MNAQKSFPSDIKAGLYVRVSTMNQVDHDSLSTQESRLKAYCQANGFAVHEVYMDKGISAKDTKRPALEELMEDCKKGRIKAVLVTAVDRITRSLRDLISLMDFFEQNNIRFVSITQNIDNSSPYGRFMRHLLGIVAQLEREVVAERVSTDMHHRASQGKWNGGTVPYGYTTQQRIIRELIAGKVPMRQAEKKAAEKAPEPKKLYVHPEEAEVLRRIFRIFLKERSIRKTADTLNSEGIRTRNGKTWAVSTIHKILTSPTSTGKISYGKTKTDIETGALKGVERSRWKVVDGLHEPLIPDGLYDEAQKVLESRRRKPTRAARSYLLSGLLKCGKCGGPMYGQTFEKKSSGKSYSYYKCLYRDTRGSSVCGGLSIPAKFLEDQIVKAITEKSRDTAFLQDRERMLASLKEQLRPDARKQSLERLRKQQRDIERKVETLVDKLASGLIKDSDFRKHYERFNADLTENRLHRERLSEMQDTSRSAYEALKASFDEISDFGRNWEFMDDPAKAMKLSSVVKQITVHKGRADMEIFLDRVEETSMRGSHR